MTIRPIHMFGKSMDLLIGKSMVLLITDIEVADVCLHRFEDRLQLLHFHFLDDAFGVVFVFAEVHCRPHARNHEYSPESLVDWEPCEAGTRQIFEQYSEELLSSASRWLRRADCGSMSNLLTLRASTQPV